MVATRELPVSTPPCRSPFYNDLGGEGDYYYNARWYDAETGRFITEDPARDGQNWYVYTSNNPLKFIDPTGLRPEEGPQAGDGPEPDNEESPADDPTPETPTDDGNGNQGKEDNDNGDDNKKKDDPKLEDLESQIPEPVTPGTEFPEAVQEIIMEEWIVTGQEFISGAAFVVTGSGMAVASGTGDFTFTNTVTGETFNASYNITQTNKGGTYAQLGLSTNTVGNPIFETSAEFPSGTTPQEVAMSYEGPFSSISVGVGVVSVSYFEGGDWKGSSVNTFAGGSTDLGIAIGEFDYELRYFYE